MVGLSRLQQAGDVGFTFSKNSAFLFLFFFFCFKKKAVKLRDKSLGLWCGDRISKQRQWCDCCLKMKRKYIFSIRAEQNRLQTGTVIPSALIDDLFCHVFFGVYLMKDCTITFE